MRCFLHLVKGEMVLTDAVGVDAVDTETAVAEIRMALWNLRAGDPDAKKQWEGWSLKIVDETGCVLSMITLDELEKA